jgi:GR25 family glycosyltransferase involved in LPS biosynthesis
MIIYYLRLILKKIANSFILIRSKSNFKTAIDEDFFVDTIFINLNHRKDRLLETQKELNKFSKIKFERVSAVKYNPGYIGCTLSHINSISMSIEKDLPYVLICEDDIEFDVSEKHLNKIFESFLKSESPILCVGNTNSINKKFNNLLNRSYNIQTTSCYLVKKSFYPILLLSYSRALRFQFAGAKDYYSAIDQVWKNLQYKYIFTTPIESILKQRPSYSDIVKKNVSYYK